MKNLSDNVAFELHEQWRKTRLKEDGSYEPRWKAIKDKEFISQLDDNDLPINVRKSENGYEIDIANVPYNKLSPDWQAENRAAAEVVVEIINSGEQLLREEIGEIIHNAWLERNSWAKDGELGVSFAELPKHEQDKDLVQYDVALVMSQAVVLKVQYGHINNAIKSLKESKDRGYNVAIDFNESRLFSEFDTPETCYLKIAGMTKEQMEDEYAKSLAEFKKVKALEEANKMREERELEQARKEREQYGLENKEGWKKQGEALIYPERIEEWRKQVESHSTMVNYGQDIEATLKIMEALESDMPMSEIVEMCRKDDFSTPIAHLTLYFSKRGPEFYKEIYKDEKFLQDKSEMIEKIESENAELAKINAKREHSKDADTDFHE